ncbi:Thioredoxin [Halobacteroides halobius DSM 5150]|uniref:Thioredoxin n=1 Tax=Halobacteroides halobius (strain ATCC 35273 / DSM 5150 / MD-1) TaxID=748449 RepID=L0K759_HALHC|nr:thioredoxin family protein [Halobacteroides halobius]AGB40365.1 Thioredoxin [Halobacteroides halobius DSM 5150]
MKGFPQVSDDNFPEIIREHEVVLMIFSSQDCGYCQLAKRNLREIIDQLSKLQVYECLISEVPEIREKYKITSVPVFKLFKEGKVVYTGFGVRESNDLYYQLSSFL